MNAVKNEGLDKPPKRTIRAVSANLRNGLADPDAFVELVTSMRADVVALQEAAPRHFDALRDAGFPHGEFEPGRKGTGLGIALRRPAKPGAISLAWRDARRMTLDPESWPEFSRPMDVVCVHISAPHVYFPPLGGFILRYRQARQLERHFATPEPAAASPGVGAAQEERGTLMLGDFNATPLWPVYRRIAAQFTDAGIAAAQARGRPAERTWGPRPGSPRMLRIDHAFTRGLETEELQVVEIEGSDHSALVVDVMEQRLSSSSPSSSSGSSS